MERRAFDFLTVPARQPKPRTRGLTIGTDPLWPLPVLEGWLAEQHDLVDLAKFTDHYGMAGRYPAEFFQRRLEVYHRSGISVFTGGVIFELAYLQGQAEPFFQRLRELGFDGVEVSADAMPPLEPALRRGLIRQATAAGLEVFTEVGSKFPERPADMEALVREITTDLESGARLVTIEAAEIQVLMQARPQTLVEVAERVGPRHIAFELKPGPWPEFPIWLFQTIGPEANVENLSLDEVHAIERWRFGLSRHAGHTFLRGGAKVQDGRYLHDPCFSTAVDARGRPRA